jgi:arsenite methyltransferase
METQISQKDKDRIESGIRSKYVKVAENPEALFEYLTGRAGLHALGYDPGLVRSLPEAVTASYCGAGNPSSRGQINEGESVLDIGCGKGVNAIIAAKMVGPSGKVTGVDIVPEMLQRAEKNLKMTDLNNVTFKKPLERNCPLKTIVSMWSSQIA